MKRKSLKELKELLLIDLNECNHSIKIFEKDQNPQVKKLYDEAFYRARTIIDVLMYIDKGQKFQFK